jgi:Mitochondrial carrier protein
MRFTLYDQLTKWLSNGSSPTAVQSLFAGGAAGAISVLVNHPVDVVKSNMQGLLGQRYTNAVQCARFLFRTEGIAGLYKVRDGFC